MQFELNNGGVVRRSAYTVFARRTFISHLPQNVNDPDSSAVFFPLSPQTRKSKRKRESDVCMQGCYRSPWAPVGLLWSSSPYLRQPCLHRTAVSQPLPSGCSPGSQATSSHRVPTEDAIVPSTCCTWSGKPRVLPELIVTSAQPLFKRD